MNLKEMLSHEFMTMNKIPDLLPISTLVCPPSNTFSKQFLSANDISNKQRFENTAPNLTSLNTVRNFNNMGLDNYKRIENSKGYDGLCDGGMLLQSAREHVQLMGSSGPSAGGIDFNCNLDLQRYQTHVVHP